MPTTCNFSRTHDTDTNMTERCVMLEGGKQTCVGKKINRDWETAQSTGACLASTTT